MAMTLFWEMKNMMSFLIMMFMMNAFHTAAGVLISKTNTTACQGSTANIDFDINLQGSTLGAGSESWYFGSTQIATKPNGSFAPQGNYSSRLSSYSTYGMSLNNTKYTDAGEYSLVFFVTSPTLLIITANASLTVYVAQTNSCVPSYTLTGKTATCFLNQTAISSNECGLPVLQTNWTIGSGTSNSTTVEISGNFTCCAYGIARNCYSGSYTFCETFPITVSSTTSTDKTCKSDSAVFIILVICIIISYTIMINYIIDWTFCYLNSTISIYMACLKTGHQCLCILYIVLLIVVVICEIIIIIMIIIGRECQTILVVGLVLGLIIIAVTIIFVIVFIITGVIICNKDTVQNPKTSTDVKITAYLHPMFISDLEWIGPKENPLSTDGKYIIAKYNSNTGETSLTITNVSQDDNGKYICQVKIGCIIAKSSIHIMCDKEMKTKKSGPPAIHIGTQNKTEPKTTSKQTNERPQPLVGGIAEDKLKPRPQPPCPEDIDAKDRNLRGLSANIDDTQGLASGTPRPIRLIPLNLNQETLQEEDVSGEKTKKKRKKKKKKGQMNEENQEEKAVELKS